MNHTSAGNTPPLISISYVLRDSYKKLENLISFLLSFLRTHFTFFGPPCTQPSSVKEKLWSWYSGQKKSTVYRRLRYRWCETCDAWPSVLACQGDSAAETYQYYHAAPGQPSSVLILLCAETCRFLAILLTPKTRLRRDFHAFSFSLEFWCRFQAPSEIAVFVPFSCDPFQHVTNCLMHWDVLRRNLRDQWPGQWPPELWWLGYISRYCDQHVIVEVLMTLFSLQVSSVAGHGCTWPFQVF